MNTVMGVLAGNGLCGVSRRVVLLFASANVTGTVPDAVDSVTVPGVTDSGLIGSLNVMRTAALTPTFTAPFTGATDVTVGVVVSLSVPR